MTTKNKTKAKVMDFGSLLTGDRDGFRELLREALQDVLEAEMTEGAARPCVCERVAPCRAGSGSRVASSRVSLISLLMLVLPMGAISAPAHKGTGAAFRSTCSFSRL
jgi:hypothetical protein